MSTIKGKRHLPFQNLPPGAWVNLALVIVAIFYILQIAADLFYNPFCKNMAVDFCAFWSAGKISNSQGYASIYDQKMLGQYEHAISVQPGDLTIASRIIPFVYLPVFVLPFQLLSSLPLKISYLVWTLLNLFAFSFYLRYFKKKMDGSSLKTSLLVLSILSMPLFLNIFWGQANIVLCICIGEFLRALVTGRSFKAGLWLGGLLLKPMMLLLIIPILLVQKAFKTLGGFSLITGIAGLISYVMVGTSGFQKLFQILLESTQGGSASSPGIMTNWRMLGFHLSSITTKEVGWLITILGLSITIVATWFISRKSYLPDPINTGVAFLGIFAATGAVTWHVHFPVAIILIPFFVYLSDQLPSAKILFGIWVFLPLILSIIMFIVSAISGLYPGNEKLILFNNGFQGLFLNLIVLIWAILFLYGKKSIHKTSDTILGKPKQLIIR